MITVKPLAHAIAGACFIMGAAPVAAQLAAAPEQQPGAAETQVVVTATRAAKAVDKIPGAVSLISQRELAAQYLLSDDPSQALAMYVPGYAPSRQKMTSTGESLRGRTPLILFDGVPQSNPLRAGMREGYFADTAIIERIEVINGASAMQGMGATGGIINYITKTPRASGTTHTLDARLSSQLRADSLDWKTGYTLTHQSDAFDLLGFTSLQRRGIGYDGDGRALGIETVQGDTMDAGGNDVFLKIGKTFGDQRVQASFNRFRFTGNGDYRNAPANVAAGIPTSAVPGTPEGEPPRNKVQTASVEYRHHALAGGAFSAQLFTQDFASLYGATNTATFQDIRIAPPPTLYDQSEVVANKHGAKLTWVRPDTLVQGLELTAGLDFLRDRTRQHLAGTGRTWVPTLDFTSTAPFMQLEYDAGPVTIRGGLRRDSASLHVDTYTTLAAYGNRVVEGGERAFSKTVKNLGAVWRFAPRWSAFVSSAEGFGLPDVGLVLRGVNKPNQSVESLFDLQPVITRNNEIGVNWRGKRGNAGLSYYDSRSKLGTALRINAAGLGVLDRVPTRVRGWEATGEAQLMKTASLFGSVSWLDGKTAVTAGTPMDVDLGARSQGPNKAVLGANWQWSPSTQLRLQAAHLADRDINAGRKAGSANLEEHFKGYTLVDLAAGWDTSHGKFGAGIENLFDRQYIGYYPQSANYKDSGSYFAGRGRSFSASWSRSF